MSGIISVLLSIWRILWRSGLFFLIWGLLLVSFLVPFTSALVKWKQTSPLEARLYGDSISVLTILIATWLMIRFLDHRPFLTIGLSSDHILKYLLVGLAVGTTWLGVSVGIAWGLGWASPIPPIGFTWTVSENPTTFVSFFTLK